MKKETTPKNPRGEGEESAITDRKKEMPEPLRRFFSRPRKNAMFVPEYAQKNFFMITGTGDRDAPLVDYRRAIVGDVPHYITRLPSLHEFQKEQAMIARAILLASKETRVTLFVDSDWNCSHCENPVSGFERIKKVFKETAPELFRPALADRFGMVRAEGMPVHRHWAQDYGESVVFEDGSSGFVVGWLPTHKDYGKMPHDKPPFDLTVVDIPVAFDGGNISFTTLDGKRYAIAGMDILEDTRAAFDAEYNYGISEKEITVILKDTFGADEVLFLSYPPRRSGNSDIGHIDQAVFFPKDGLAVMQKPASGKAGMRKGWEEETGQYRQQLMAAGFNVIDLPITPEAAKVFNSYMSYANSIPIQNGGKEITIVMPKYGDKKIEWDVWHILYNNGMKVSFVPDIAYKFGGGPHCLVGSLSNGT